MVRWAASASPPKPPPPGAHNFSALQRVECGAPGGAAVAAASAAACEARCEADASCSCATYDAAAGTCAKRQGCLTGDARDNNCVAHAGATTLFKEYTLVPARNCFSGHGAVELDGNTPIKNTSVAECVAHLRGRPRVHGGAAQGVHGGRRA